MDSIQNDLWLKIKTHKKEILKMKKYTEYTVEELKEMVFEVNNWDGTLEDYNFL